MQTCPKRRFLSASLVWFLVVHFDCAHRFRFVVPFIALLPRWAKRTPAHLVSVCLLILVMQYVDLFWLVYPNYSTEFVAFSWLEVGAFIGFLGCSRWSSRNFWRAIISCRSKILAVTNPSTTTSPTKVRRYVLRTARRRAWPGAGCTASLSVI